MNKLNLDYISVEEKVFLLKNRIKTMESHKKKLLSEISDYDYKIEYTENLLNEIDLNGDIDNSKIFNSSNKKTVKQSKKYIYVSLRLFETVKNHFVNNKPENITLTRFLREEVKRYLESNSEETINNHVFEYDEFYEAWKNEYPIKVVQLGILNESFKELEEISERLNVKFTDLMHSVVYNIYQNI